MPRKAASTVAAEPSAACLRFSFEPSLLGPEGEAAIGAHYRTCVAFEDRWSDLCDRRQTLLDQSRDVVHGVLVDTAIELSTERVALQSQLDQLFAARRTLCESLVQHAAAAAEAGRQDHEKALADLEAAYAARGVDVNAMPAAGSNPKAAERQLRFKIENDDHAVASLGRLRRVEAACREVAAVAEADHATAVLVWPEVPIDANKLASFLGLASEGRRPGAFR